MNTNVARAAGRLLGEVVAELLGGAAVQDDSGLLGLERKPCERKAKPMQESVLLTLREDLTGLRERMLKGVGRRAALRELDYTIDQLDNALGEM